MANKRTNLNNIVRRFTAKESFAILKDLIDKGKATDETYTLILLWLTGLLNNESYAHLKAVSGGNIIVHDINSNTDELIELVHDLVLELMYHKVNELGKGIGLKYKVSWDCIPIRDKTTKEITHHLPIEGNEGMVVSFINRAFRNFLYKCLGKSYRGEISYSNLYTLKHTTRMIELRERLKEEVDTSITTPELIKKLKEEGYEDATLFQYRYIYSLGSWKNFTEMTEDTMMRGSVNQQLENLTSTDNYKKILYEQMVQVLNSDLMPKVNREFIKCYYGIPSLVKLGRFKKIFEPDMVLFFEMYPDYKKILKVKRISYSGKRRNVKWVDKEDLIQHSIIYKESHAMIRGLLTPAVDSVHAQYSENIASANDILSSFNANTSKWGSDSYFNEMTDLTEDSFDVE